MQSRILTGSGLLTKDTHRLTKDAAQGNVAASHHRPEAHDCVRAVWHQQRPRSVRGLQASPLLQQGVSAAALVPTLRPTQGALRRGFQSIIRKEEERPRVCVLRCAQRHKSLLGLPVRGLPEAQGPVGAGCRIEQLMKYKTLPCNQTSCRPHAH